MARTVKRGVGRPRKSSSMRRNVQAAISNVDLENDKIVDETVRAIIAKSIMTGDLPPFSDWSNVVADHANHRIFLYGGCHPKDDFFSSNFHCCDIRTMRWTDCTVCPSRAHITSTGSFNVQFSTLCSFCLIHPTLLQTNLANDRYQPCKSRVVRSSLSMENPLCLYLVVALEVMLSPHN